MQKRAGGRVAQVRETKKFADEGRAEDRRRCASFRKSRPAPKMRAPLGNGEGLDASERFAIPRLCPVLFSKSSFLSPISKSLQEGKSKVKANAQQ